MSGAPQAVTRRAHAKINVFLRVLGRRDDGFHDVETVVLPITLHDVVTVAHGDGFSLETGGVLAADAPSDPAANLACRAAAALAERTGRELDVAMRLVKRIPVAAGLGGGSADAAASLLALDELWSCGMSAEELAELGATLGADVPAMLAGGPMLAGGRGERLTPVHAATTWWAVRPFEAGISAADAYAWWDEAPATGPDPGALIAALEVGDLDLLGDALFNDLQAGVAARRPEVEATLEAFVAAGALGALVSGSGPTVAALARHVGHADSLADAVPGSTVVSAPPTRPEVP